MGRFDNTDDFTDDMVCDPDKKDVVFLDKLTERELLDLLFRLVKKAKAVKIKHVIRHGYLLDVAKTLRRLYMMNLHRWGKDDGMSKEKIEWLELSLRNALCPDTKQE